MVLTLTWLGTAVAAPALRARRALRRGRRALLSRNLFEAQQHLRKAARFEPLREESVCLMAEASLYAHKPSDALFALNTLLMEQDAARPEGEGAAARSPRVRLLRGIAGCMVGRPAAARRELAAISKSIATTDELLAAAQACILANDPPGAHALLDLLEGHPTAGTLRARIQLCRAALHFRAGAPAKSLAALPAEAECSTGDAQTVAYMRGVLRSGGNGA